VTITQGSPGCSWFLLPASPPRLRLLRKERSAFERTRAEQLAQLEEHKKEAHRKLHKERQLLEQHAARARAIPDRKEREEIQVG